MDCLFVLGIFNAVELTLMLVITILVFKEFGKSEE